MRKMNEICVDLPNASWKIQLLGGFKTILFYLLLFIKLRRC